MRRLLSLLSLWLALGAAARAADTTPFFRMGEPNILVATAAPQQYQITQPVGATSYRGVNPCVHDIRVKSVMAIGDTVTATTGTRFLARTSEVLASSPQMTNPRVVSIMVVPHAGGPAIPAGFSCPFELTYGSGQ
ncbi:hypothetical protein [Methylobacterium isbiliense]|uniref:Uncharacterized protein n=1 Tax=Methylobacterium isbiliense TaxID=315478 RepID=A0ABQ4SDD2_9HYPH|nr:hypothetical protein [Methylobacterium isbiliense]MDN3622592.1 hypothetical protein [Methylobacterium isbiliense]GJE00559.1 hypothetical protein GMJLKIPL_2482 [Methylobacterium isbiliense]